ncbi:hypothetical protein BBK36DRAFT_1157874 [Trichoderma citrinoviride]|uniref:Uncharacterized protein n=1 Tax=Trichoderma citrinoviride TaxID=58853 RepID=A0A2T4BG01_9HYPO|nr:hypothetical protein BBK36DRAFT_1157874 [Trichoderma citrinoviride]PTB68201.1 hypothetical protein BBK36DRAFT_1157874 [Trichoderma citrinoviride]
MPSMSSKLSTRPHTSTGTASSLFDPAQHRGVSSRLNPFTFKSSDQKFMWLAATRPLGEGGVLAVLIPIWAMYWLCLNVSISSQLECTTRLLVAISDESESTVLIG